MGVLYDEVERIEREVDTSECDVALCHNDLWLGNILYDKNKGQISLTS